MALQRAIPFFISGTIPDVKEGYVGARRSGILFTILLVLVIAIIAGLAVWALHLWPVAPTQRAEPTPVAVPSTPTTTGIASPSHHVTRRVTRSIICPTHIQHTPPRITLSTYPEAPTLSDPEWPGFDVFVKTEAGKIVRTTYTRQDGTCVAQEKTEEPDVISRVLLQVFPVGDEAPIVKELLLNIQPPYGVETWDGGYHVVPKNAGTFEVKVRVRTAKGQVAEAETSVVVYEGVIQTTPTPTSEAQTP